MPGLGRFIGMTQKMTFLAQGTADGTEKTWVKPKNRLPRPSQGT